MHTCIHSFTRTHTQQRESHVYNLHHFHVCPSLSVLLYSSSLPLKSGSISVCCVHGQCVCLCVIVHTCVCYCAYVCVCVHAWALVCMHVCIVHVCRSRSGSIFWTKPVDRQTKGHGDCSIPLNFVTGVGGGGGHHDHIFPLQHLMTRLAKSERSSWNSLARTGRQLTFLACSCSRDGRVGAHNPIFPLQHLMTRLAKSERCS